MDEAQAERLIAAVERLADAVARLVGPVFVDTTLEADWPPDPDVFDGFPATGEAAPAERTFDPAHPCLRCGMAFGLHKMPHPFEPEPGWDRTSGAEAAAKPDKPDTLAENANGRYIGLERGRGRPRAEQPSEPPAHVARDAERPKPLGPDFDHPGWGGNVPPLHRWLRER